MSQAKRPRDPNLDHPAVKKYRDIIRLTPNWIQRRDIALTVHVNGNGELDLWEEILIRFMREGRNPKRVDWLCDRFETALRNGKASEHS
jgi:hypothetical protein